jgi:hypothetical protein
VYEVEELVCVCVYRKGATEVQALIQRNRLLEQKPNREKRRSPKKTTTTYLLQCLHSKQIRSTKAGRNRKAASEGKAGSRTPDKSKSYP